ncbi:hypothetical protein [Glycomyces salinus]|uniref:hypothetical protein n=1 Tax=Glycomyces salinus TaxID=980294 RepID=UPI0018ED9F77|nr:hypothetical protein [Glycomyces salinus]
MQKRHAIGGVVAAIAVAATALAGGMSANAETTEEPTPAPADAGGVAAETVMLPTGDTVTVAPNGATAINPAEGREDIGFLTLPVPGARDETLVIPHDVADEIRSGQDDARRYNVSALAEEGHTDAAEVSDADLSGPEDLFAAEEDPTAAAQTLTVTLRDRAGAVPDGSWVTWSSDQTDEFDSIEFDENGVGTIALEPGSYTIVHETWNDPTEDTDGENVLGMTPVTIGDEPTQLVIDGAEAAEVSAEVDRPDAELLGEQIVIEARSRSGDDWLATGAYGGPDIDFYLMPEPELPDHELGFIYQPVLAAPEGTEDDYVYNLAFHERGGFPDETAFHPSDEDLAVEETTYHSLGADVEGFTCDYGDATPNIGHGLCYLVPTSFPAERTMYYTADPDIEWSGFRQAGVFSDQGRLVDGFVDSLDRGSLEAGETTRAFVHGPLAAGVPEAFLYSEEGTPYFYASTGPAGSLNDEELRLKGHEGTAVLSTDGQKVGVVEGIDPEDGFEFDLTGFEAGRYTLHVASSRSTDTALVGTASTQEWAFDLDPSAVPSGGSTDMTLPVIAVETDGVDGGFTEAGDDVDVELSLAAAEYLPEVEAEEMALQVSFDDGLTWEEIELDCDGGAFTGEIEHPDDAEYVSVRMTALDDAGTEITHTTIRAYGLR